LKATLLDVFVSLSLVMLLLDRGILDLFLHGLILLRRLLRACASARHAGLLYCTFKSRGD
jgi:hypothetical protein